MIRIELLLIINEFIIQIKYSLSCLQCPTMYAQMDEKTGEALQISKAIPLPALNVRRSIELHSKAVLCIFVGAWEHMWLHDFCHTF